MKVRASIKKVTEDGRRKFRRHTSLVEEPENMPTTKIYVTGIGEYYNTLSIRLPQPVGWREFKDILGIEGVVHYSIQSRRIYVRYELNIVDPIEVAGACMTVVARHLGTQVSELDIAFYNSHDYSTENPAISEAIRTHALEAATPPTIPMSRIVSRGNAPAYYLG